MTTATRPNHYKTTDGIECIDALRAMLGQERFEGFLQGNILKYVWRYRDKGGKEDLEKAKIYMQWLIDCQQLD